MQLNVGVAKRSEQLPIAPLNSVEHCAYQLDVATRVRVHICDPCGIRTRDLYLERVASWAARRTGRARGGAWD
jgi:hypothetical protein